VAELIGKIGDDAQAIPVVEDGETIGTVTAGSIVSRLQSE
jgi:glycine betaine/proline transport system ATP-binding protein